MKKTLRSSLAWASVLVILISIFSIPTAVVADTKAPVMEYFYVDGYETDTEQELTGMTASMPITMGVTGDGLVADGYDAAMKITSLGNQGNGLNYAYLVSYPDNSLPFATVPEKLSEWETMKFYLSHEVKAAGAEPRGLQVILLDKNGGAIAGAYVLFDHCRRDTPTGKFWVELEPSDFYAFPNYSVSKTKLTAFPDAYSIGFRIDNFMSPAGEADVKDADGLLTPHYLAYSGGDCWTAIDVYISGLQYAREKEEIVDTKTEYFYVDGYETATEQELTGMTASMPITMGVTGEGLVADGYDAAMKITSLGDQGNGKNYAYLVSYPDNSLPFATVPEKLSEWETMKFYLSHEVKAAGSQPFGLQVILLDQKGGAIAGAYVLFDHCRRDNPTGKFWVELEPSDFYAFPNYSISKTKLTAFPDAYSIGFRIDNFMSPAGEADVKDADGLLTPHYLFYSGGDCWAAFDVYISGLQYAREREEIVDTKAEYFTKTEYFYVDGYETATEDTIDSLWIENGSYTGGITIDGRVAEGYDAALKIGFVPNSGWYTAYLYDKETHNRPFTVIPEKLSEWDSIKYYVSPDFDTFTNGIPWSLHCVLLDENGNKLAAAFPLLGTHTGNFWVELKPSDFHQIDYSSGSPVVTATTLTTFPDAYCIGWEINGSFTAVGINGHKDANGEDSAYHYMVYSGYDGYKGGDVYISGLQYVREVTEMPSLSMIAGASVRLSAPSGLRFSTKVMGVDTLEQLKADGIITDYRLGTLVAPVDYLNGKTDFTKETVPNALDIARTKWAAATEEYLQMNAAIVNINTWNYDRGFAARAYLEIDWAVDGSTQVLYSEFDMSTIDAAIGEHDHIRSVAWAAQKLIDMGIYAEGSTEDTVLKEFVRDVSAS